LPCSKREITKSSAGSKACARYIKTSYLGRMLAAAQEDISGHLVKALGSPPGMA
jgi:hypothetical protein